jgi:hypothetical protein
MIDILKAIATFIPAFLLATILIRRCIPLLKNEAGEPTGLPEGSTKDTTFDFRSTGFWIGFFETLLVYVFVYLGEIGALAIIIGAKEFVRKDNIRENPSYYLLGTFINVTLALFGALLAKGWIGINFLKSSCV